ncbi:TPA: hypothetical protein EYP66_13985 [Candidatus Poribacteria bacterium]|nr:hypothetical protein [Candidatus Poribacteria bacterium]
MGDSQNIQRNFWIPVEPPRANYFIDVFLDESRNQIEGKETITFVNQTAKPIDKLALQWGLSRERNLVVSIGGEPVDISKMLAKVEANRPLLLELPESLLPGEEIELVIDFSASIGELRYGIRMLIEWHPRLWWDYPTHDDFEVKLSAPESYIVATSGRLDETSGTYRACGVKQFGIVAGQRLKLLEAMSGDVLVHTLYTERGRVCAQLLLETAVDVIDFYRSEFGFYPQPILSTVPGDDRPMGGFPFATNIVSIHGQEKFDEKPKDFWRWITAHEVGHQYWGEYVMEADNPGWLWIGLGIYADREYSRARGLNEELHQGFFNRYIKGIRDGTDTTVERPLEQLAKINFDHNNIVIHGKGFAIISALESVIGRDAFRRAYQRCLQTLEGRRLGARKFQKVCEEETGQDLEWFFSQWLRTNRYLSYQIAAVEKSHQANCHVTTVRVEQTGNLEMPIPVEACFEDGSHQCALTEPLLRMNELTFESDAPLVEVQLDPEKTLPLIDPPLTPNELEMSQMIQELPWTGSGERAVDVFKKACEYDMKTADSWGKLGLTLYDGEYYEEALEAFRKVVEFEPKSIWGFAARVWQGHLLDLLDRRDEAVEQYRIAQEMEDVGTMRHDQYGLVINQEWVKVRLQTPFQRKMKA